MPLPKSKGFTLVELLVTLAILLVVITVVGTALYSAFQGVAANRKLEDDQYYARMALLAITRDVHRGVEINTTGDKLIFTHEVSGGVTYLLKEDAVNNTFVLSREGDSPVPFTPAKLAENGFITDRVDKNNNSIKSNVNDDESNYNWLSITITCTDGMELTTKISINRIVQ